MATTNFNAAYDLYKNNNNAAPAVAPAPRVRRAPVQQNTTHAQQTAVREHRAGAAVPAQRPVTRPSAPQRPAKPVAVPEKRPTSEQMIDEFVQRVKKTVKIFVCCSLFFFMAGVLIHQNAQLIELNKEYVKCQQQFERAKSENVSLEAQFNSLISIENVEEYAKTKLGMVKRQSHQVKTFRLEGEDKVVLVNGAPTEDGE